MIGLKAFIEETLVREKEKLCFILLEKHKIFAWAVQSILYHRKNNY